MYLQCGPVHCSDRCRWPTISSRGLLPLWYWQTMLWFSDKLPSHVHHAAKKGLRGALMAGWPSTSKVDISFRCIVCMNNPSIYRYALPAGNDCDIQSRTLKIVQSNVQSIVVQSIVQSMYSRLWYSIENSQDCTVNVQSIELKIEFNILCKAMQWRLICDGIVDTIYTLIRTIHI